MFKSFCIFIFPVPGYVVVIQPDGQILNVGTDVTFSCQVEAGSPYNDPVWFDPRGREITDFGRGMCHRHGKDKHALSNKKG